MIHKISVILSQLKCHSALVGQLKCHSMVGWWLSLVSKQRCFSGVRGDAVSPESEVIHKHTQTKQVTTVTLTHAC